MPRHGFLLAAAEWFRHVRHCSYCEFHEPNCTRGEELSRKMDEMGGDK